MLKSILRPRTNRTNFQLGMTQSSLSFSVSAKDTTHIVREKKEVVKLSSEIALEAAFKANSRIKTQTDYEVEDDERIKSEVEAHTKMRERLDAAADKLIQKNIGDRFKFAETKMAKAVGISKYVNARKEHAAYLAKNSSYNRSIPEMIAEFSSSNASHRMTQEQLTLSKYAKYFMPAWDPVIQKASDSPEVHALLEQTTPEYKPGFFGKIQKFLSPPPKPLTIQDLDLVGETIKGYPLNLRQTLCCPGKISLVLTYNSESGFESSKYTFLKLMEEYHNRTFQLDGYKSQVTVDSYLIMSTSHMLTKFISKDKLFAQIATRYPECDDYLHNIVAFFLKDTQDEPFHRWKVVSNTLNRFSSYLFLVDQNGKIRWSGNINQLPSEDEFARLHNVVKQLISETITLSHPKSKNK